jgi:hypothetical protein
MWGSVGIAPSFLTSAVAEGEWSASRPCLFTSAGRATGTHWIEGWVAPRACLDAVEEKILDPTGIQTSWPSAVQPVASQYTDCTENSYPYQRGQEANPGNLQAKRCCLPLSWLKCLSHLPTFLFHPPFCYTPCDHNTQPNRCNWVTVLSNRKSNNLLLTFYVIYVDLSI